MSTPGMLSFKKALSFIQIGDWEGFYKMNLSDVINVQDEKKETLLTLACANSVYLDIVKHLLSQPNIEVNISSSSGSPLFIATSKGLVDIVLELLSHPQIDVNKGTEASTPLYHACERNFTEVVKVLLTCTSNPFDVNKGDSPLYQACKNGNLEIVELLVQQPDLDVNLGPLDNSSETLDEGQPKRRISPLHAALEGEHFEIITELMKCAELDIVAELEFADSLRIEIN